MSMLRDHFAAAFERTPDRFRRLCSIIIDGVRLGDYRTDRVFTRNEAKRLEEMQWLGIALVGCDADLEVREIRALSESHKKAVPDFEATLGNGDVVRLELARVVLGGEAQQNGYFASIAAQAQSMLEDMPAVSNAGTFIYRVYDETGTSIGKAEAAKAAHELVEFITGDPRLRFTSTTLHPAEDAKRYPTLHRLGIHVNHSEPFGSSARVMWQPMPEHSDARAARAAFDRVLQRKIRKVPDYSDQGRVPVWLVFGAFSLRQHFIALTLVDQLALVDDLEVRPFTRVMVGCFSAGVTFEEPFTPPRYTSLTKTG